MALVTNAPMIDSYLSAGKGVSWVRVPRVSGPFKILRRRIVVFGARGAIPLSQVLEFTWMLRAVYDQIRAFAMGRSPKWPTLARLHLATHSACAACGVKDKSCTPHHIVPVHVDAARELDPSNLITLCESSTHNCHLIFGHFLNWTSWNTQVVADAAEYLKKVKTRPEVKS